MPHVIFYGINISMLWAVDSNEIDKLLSNRRECIGRRIEKEAIFSGITLMISALGTEYVSFGILTPMFFKWFFFILGVGSLALVFYDYLRYHDAYKYNSNMMFEDIRKLNMIQHEHSLLCFKQADKYLVYFDTRWSCFLFPNYKTRPTNNENNLIHSFAKDLDLSADNISLVYVSQDIREKYSVSAKSNKLYHHLLFKVNIKDLPELMGHADFSVNDKHYYWKTVDELLSDKATYEFNSDIINFVNDAIMS